jgi:hypothetical protein
MRFSKVAMLVVLVVATGGCVMRPPYEPPPPPTGEDIGGRVSTADGIADKAAEGCDTKIYGTTTSGAAKAKAAQVNVTSEGDTFNVGVKSARTCGDQAVFDLVTDDLFNNKASWSPLVTRNNGRHSRPQTRTTVIAPVVIPERRHHNQRHRR